jgi:hypothetical protein
LRELAMVCSWPKREVREWRKLALTIVSSRSNDLASIK